MIGQEPAPSHVVLTRAVLYGATTGLVWAALLPAALAILEYETFDFFPIFALWGAGVGAGVGLVLGITVVLGGVARSKHQGYWRLLIAAMAAALLFATIWALGGNPTSWSSLILAVPAGIAAWLLLPMVLRPQAREPLPPLGT